MSKVRTEERTVASSSRNHKGGSNTVIIVAGGSGLRMRTEVPKQFMLLSGTPVLMHTIARFHAWDHTINIIVVLPAKETVMWQSMCEKFKFAIRHTVVTGG